MPRLQQSLSVKITGILLAFFLAALTAIGLTLFISWQLEGAAAAINDAGSLRMRAYRIAYHLARANAEMKDPAAFARAIEADLRDFEEIIAGLGKGDPLRPLFIPKDEDIRADVAGVGEFWHSQIRPSLDELIAEPSPDRLRARLPALEDTIAAFVTGVHSVVLKMEHRYARNTNILRASQVLLIALAVVGTVALIRFFFVTVIRPVGELQAGMHRMEQEDFNARVPVLVNDEFGKLSEGFNRMAAHLQGLYATLEERVAAKTRSLADKNRELEILYDIGAFLREPAGDVDTLCHGFLQRVQHTLGACASSARLLDTGSQNLCLTVHEGLDKDFLAREAVLACGECLCGDAVQRGVSFVADTSPVILPITLDTCRRAGFGAVSATAITANKRSLGVFNLYFQEARPLAAADRLLLETLGQQLGIAIENQRLHARDRELAVSEERNLLARELHDSIAQGLAFLNLQVQMLEKSLANGSAAEARDTLAMIRQGVQESYDDVRELLVHFRTRVEQQDLDEAITASLRRLAEQTGVATDLDVQGDGAPLDPEAETQVLYIVQEALSNVRKHSGAHSVQVSVRRGMEGLTVAVRDDGIGFDENARNEPGAGEAHIGLQIMRERAMRIGGQFAIRSSRGKGTEIRLDLPRRHKETA